MTIETKEIQVTKREDYPVGVPCWVDTWQPDPRAALHFYGPLLGWSFDEPTELPAGRGSYFTARLARSRVAGVGQSPPSSPAVWSTYVRVKELESALARAEATGGTQLAEPMEIGSEGRLAVLSDATGVPFGLWQAGELSGAELVAEPGAWAMSSLHTPDVERATVFYNTVFGWELVPVPDAPFSQWRLGGQMIGVVTATDGSAVPPHWSVNFAVGDADAVAQHATALGGTVVMGPFDTPGLRNAVIADPQGGVIAVSATAG
jgi:uncharacterized protein